MERMKSKKEGEILVGGKERSRASEEERMLKNSSPPRRLEFISRISENAGRTYL